MVKRLIKLSALTIVVSVVLQFLLFYSLLPYSYISSIKTVSYTKDDYAMTFAYFNTLADYSLIKVKGLRAVTIEEDDAFLDKTDVEGSQTLGLTICGTFSCKVYIRSNMNPQMFREVLLHEMVHTYGFGHTNDKFDLMFFSNSDILRDGNIKEWALRLKDRILTWKML